MRFLPNDEQIAMAQAVRDVLSKECPPEVLRNANKVTQRSAVRATLASLGVFGLTVGEEHGGLGLDQRDAMGVLVETGRAAVPGPIAETFAAVQLLQSLPQNEHSQRWLPQLAAGGAVATVGLEDGSLVESADEADLLILQLGADLHLVEQSAVRLVPNKSIDPNRHQFAIDWQPMDHSLLASGEPALATLRDHLLLALSAQLLGLSKQILDLTVKHVTTREQFGRPLGVFQAVQHRLADVAVAIDFAEPVVARAACALADGAVSASRDAAMAKVFASAAAERSAYTGLQLHGAIGYTQEHDFHLYALRAWALALAHGDAHRHRERVAADLLGPAPTPRFPSTD
jgi:alkylation response protein AidB-like acyl-CoA dehydrogenase